MNDKQRTAVRLSSKYIERLDLMAKAIGCPRATIIHNAIVAYVDAPAQITASAARLAQTTEYMQIVLDLIVSRDMPEKRDAILTTVVQRLEQFHGGL
jgi:predicted DNA-binding protein